MWRPSRREAPAAASPPPLASPAMLLARKRFLAQRGPTSRSSISRDPRAVCTAATERAPRHQASSEGGTGATRPCCSSPMPAPWQVAAKHALIPGSLANHKQAWQRQRSPTRHARRAVSEAAGAPRGAQNNKRHLAVHVHHRGSATVARRLPLCVCGLERAAPRLLQRAQAWATTVSCAPPPQTPKPCLQPGLRCRQAEPGAQMRVLNPA